MIKLVQLQGCELLPTCYLVNIDPAHQIYLAYPLFNWFQLLEFLSPIIAIIIILITTMIIVIVIIITIIIINVIFIVVIDGCNCNQLFTMNQKAGQPLVCFSWLLQLSFISSTVYGKSSSVTKDAAKPERPARAVRPHLC